TYRPAVLFQLWREWRDRVAAYPASLYFSLLFFHHLLPSQTFNAMFSALFRGFGASHALQSAIAPAAPIPSQRLVDVTWGIALLSNLVMVSVPFRSDLRVNVVAYDILVPCLLAYLVYRGFIMIRLTAAMLLALASIGLIAAHVALFLSG